jgi:azurin
LNEPRVDGQPIDTQLEQLKAFEDRARYRARRALRGHPTEAVVQALARWIARLDPGHQDYEHHLLEALWVYQHHDTPEPKLLRQLLEAKDYRARAAAVRVLHHWFDRVDDGMALLKRMVQDPAPRVRLEAVRALSFIPTVEAAETALDALRQPTDYYLQYTLDSTITTLQKVWKPALQTTQSTGRPLSGDNPAGLSFLLSRLTPEELIAAPPSTPVFHALLTRPGVTSAQRQAALEGLAKQNGTTVFDELVRALERIDVNAGANETSRDLAQLLLTTDRARLAGGRSHMERLALESTNETIRQGAFAALMQGDGGVARAWDASAASPRSRIDLLNGASLLADRTVLADLYSKITPLLETPSRGTPSTEAPAKEAPAKEAPAKEAPAKEAPAKEALSKPSGRFLQPPVLGRYVRLALLGRDQILRLAEVQVFSQGQNIAAKGTATQSSTVAGGTAIGGHASRAIDGRIDTAPAAGSLAFTSQEQDPWWELDLGDTRPIEVIGVWNVPEQARGREVMLYLSVLDATRRPVFTKEGLRTTVPTETVALAGDLTIAVQNAAINALPSVPGHDQESFERLARLMQTPAHRQAAIAAIRRIPKASWPTPQIAPLAEQVVAYVRAIPAADRTASTAVAAVAFGRDLAEALPGDDGKRITAALDELVVRTIRIVAVASVMKFDVGRFSVGTNEEVEILFVNPDELPHNLLITAPGTLEAVGLAAEAMAKQPDGFAKHFIPDTPDVLHSTPLINQGETARLRFTAPAKAGQYPFVCTFPGHWRTMNGIMEVTRNGT